MCAHMCRCVRVNMHAIMRVCPHGGDGAASPPQRLAVWQRVSPLLSDKTLLTK